MDIRDQHKRRAAESAVETVSDDAVVGLGSGSTAAHAIRSIGTRVADGAAIVGVPSSYQAADLAREVGIPVRTPADVPDIDVTIDGADQVAGNQLIKGGGASHTRERVVATAAGRFLVVVDDEKVESTLDVPVPVEVLSDARPLVAAAIDELGGTPIVRLATEKSGPVITDNGNQILDCAFGAITDPAALARSLAPIPGVVDHGLFVDLADRIHVGTDDGVDIIECRRLS